MAFLDSHSLRLVYSYLCFRVVLGGLLMPKGSWQMGSFFGPVFWVDLASFPAFPHLLSVLPLEVDVV